MIHRRIRGSTLRGVSLRSPLLGGPLHGAGSWGGMGKGRVTLSG